MSKKKFKESFKDGFNSGARFAGIHSVGDLFKFGFRGGLKIIKTIFEIMFH